MADRTISALDAAIALTGTEAVPIVQATSTVRTTAQDIANLALSAVNVVSNALSNELSVRAVAVDAVSNAASHALSVAQAASVAVDVVSTALSNLISLHNVLSNRVSANSGTGGSGSVTSQELSVAAAGLSGRIDTASALGTTADTHAGTASAAATSVDAKLINVSARTSTGGATSIKGLQSVINTLSAQVSNLLSLHDVLSNRVSANSGTGGGGSVTSQELSVAAAGLSARIDTASALGTTADTHAGTASLAATSVDGRVNSVNTFLSGLSVRTSVGGATSIHGVQSVLNALSTQISNEASVRAASVQTASAAATSVDGRLNNVSTRTSVGGVTSTKGLQSALNNLSAQNSNEASVRAASVQTASAAAAAADARVTSVNLALSGLSVRTSSGGATSIHGLQSLFNTLSTQISNEASIRAVSVNTASAAATSVDGRLNNVSVRTSSGGATSIKGLQSALNTLSTQISNEASIRAVSVNTASLAATSVDGRLNNVSVRTSTGGATSIKGLQSAFNTLSTQISNLLSLHDVLSNRVSANSGAAGVSAKSVGGTSVRGLQSVVDALSNRISAVIAGATSVTSTEYSVRTTAGVSIRGFQSIFNALSNRISAAGGGAGSVTSTELSAHSAALSCRAFSANGSAATSVKGHQSVINQISNTLSNAFSAGSVTRGRTRIITATVAQSVGTALTDIAGTTVEVSANFYYEYRAHLNVAMSAANTFGIGITFPAQTGGACTGTMIAVGSVGNSAWESAGNTRIQGFDDDGSGSIIMSILKGVVSVTPCDIVANFAPTANGNIVLQYRSSVSTSNLKINPGSFVRLFKLTDTGA